MLICPSCGHQNPEGSKFCEKCGAALQGQTAGSSPQPNVQHAATSEQAASGKPNEYLETTKKVSKQYFSYFLDVLKRPDGNGMKYGTDSFVNAIITFVLFSLIMPLTFYIHLSKGFGEVSFAAVVIKPLIAFLIFQLIFASIIFAVLKLDQSPVAYKTVFVRYGSLLIPFTAIMILGALFTFIGMYMWGISLLSIGFFSSLGIIPPVLIAGFKQNRQHGIDNIYLIFIVQIVTGIAIAILFSMIADSFELENLMYELFGIY
ncbi:zinc-ribbon domain-containing protein [Terribacillus saccharophilus]|uniref:zinc ribbon domain-containing protein n=1 Tax=Terribacillus saccharophilus TaxID=361277 RepID=UPI0039828CCD